MDLHVGDTSRVSSWGPPTWRHIKMAAVVGLLCLEELYGDFEDLETGEVHKNPTGKQNRAEVRLIYTKPWKWSFH